MNYKDIPEGEFTARVVSARTGKSAQKQTPYVEITWVIPSLEEVTIRSTHYVTKATIPYFLPLMASLSWNNDEQFREGSLDKDKMMTLVIQREWGSDNIERPKVQYVNDPDAPFAFEQESDPTALVGMNLKAEMAAFKNGERTKPKPKPKPQVEKDAYDPASHFDSSEEIPF